jgi:hypothetical protein
MVVVCGMPCAMSTRDSNSSNGGQNAELLIDEADRTHRFWVLKG